MSQSSTTAMPAGAVRPGAIGTTRPSARGETVPALPTEPSGTTFPRARHERITRSATAAARSWRSWPSSSPWPRSHLAPPGLRRPALRCAWGRDGAGPPGGRPDPRAQVGPSRGLRPPRRDRRLPPAAIPALYRGRRPRWCLGAPGRGAARRGDPVRRELRSSSMGGRFANGPGTTPASARSARHRSAAPRWPRASTSSWPTTARPLVTRASSVRSRGRPSSARESPSSADMVMCPSGPCEARAGAHGRVHRSRDPRSARRDACSCRMRLRRHRLARDVALLPTPGKRPRVALDGPVPLAVPPLANAAERPARSSASPS